MLNDAISSIKLSFFNLDSIMVSLSKLSSHEVNFLVLCFHFSVTFADFNCKMNVILNDKPACDKNKNNMPRDPPGRGQPLTDKWMWFTDVKKKNKTGETCVRIIQCWIHTERRKA